RHTRFSRDWSSDVCSSDLARGPSAHPQTCVNSYRATRILLRCHVQYLRFCGSVHDRYWEKDGVQSENSIRPHTMKTICSRFRSWWWYAVGELPSCFPARCFRLVAEIPFRRSRVRVEK